MCVSLSADQMLGWKCYCVYVTVGQVYSLHMAVQYWFCIKPSFSIIIIWLCMWVCLLKKCWGGNVTVYSMWQWNRSHKPEKFWPRLFYILVIVPYLSVIPFHSIYVKFFSFPLFSPKAWYSLKMLSHSLFHMGSIFFVFPLFVFSYLYTSGFWARYAPVRCTHPSF